MKPWSLPAVALICSRVLGLEAQTPLAASSAPSSAPPYREALVSLHKSLVEISSISGHENDVGSFLVDYLEQRGFVVQIEALPPADTNDTEPAKPRFNVLAWPGPNRRPSPKVLVSSHIDTVPPFIPYARNDSGQLTDDTLISGRGSVDAKASVAAQIVALQALLESGRIAAEEADAVMLLYVVGEETSGDGMRFFSSTRGQLDPPPTFRAAIFGEPTEGRLVCGHKGIFGCEVTAHGRAGHSGYPWLGKSATEVLMRGLVRVLDTDLGSTETMNTTVNVGLLSGGAAGNVIPELAKATITGRVAIGPELDGGKIVAERFKEVLRSVDEEAFEIDCTYGYGVVECDCDVEGFETTTVNYGTDVHNLAGNHTRYLYGPGTIFVAHGPDEAIKLSDLESAVEGYKDLIMHALKEN
ncbi:Zn-dependent exopeptidase [Hypomontagnella submonticulosa]|nr:Zn-dependent exopeptidase [Hypomontagnella submonticulosa]